MSADIDIPRRRVFRFVLVRAQLLLHRLAPGQPVLLGPAGIIVPPGSRSNRPLRHIHHPFGLNDLDLIYKKIIAKNGL
jgi:hypothetical protein